MAEETNAPFSQRGFNPRSPDAMFATILAKLEEHGETSRQILAQVEKTNGRVTSLERWRDIVTAKTAVIAATLSVLVTVAVKVLFG